MFKAFEIENATTEEIAGVDLYTARDYAEAELEGMVTRATVYPRFGYTTAQVFTNADEYREFLEQVLEDEYLEFVARVEDARAEIESAAEDALTRYLSEDSAGRVRYHRKDGTCLHDMPVPVEEWAEFVGWQSSALPTADYIRSWSSVNGDWRDDAENYYGMACRRMDDAKSSINRMLGARDVRVFDLYTAIQKADELQSSAETACRIASAFITKKEFDALWERIEAFFAAAEAACELTFNVE